MKKIRFDKLVTLMVNQTEETTEVMVNGVRFVYEDGVLKEEVDKLTVKKAKEIEAKYTKQEDWQYSKEDIEAIQAEVKTYQVKEEIELQIAGENVIEKVKELLNK